MRQSVSLRCGARSKLRENRAEASFRTPGSLIALVLVVVPFFMAASDKAPSNQEIVLRNGRIIDGTGAKETAGDILIRGDRIAAIGKVEVGRDTKVVDIKGLVVAPGFIDLHTHSDGPIVVPATRANRNYQFQGVTTVVTGNCGSGPIDVKEFFEKIDREGAGTNVIHLVPLGSVRGSVLGNGDPNVTADAVKKMAGIVDRGMKAGAWGVSSGLIYLPGRYAKTEELIAMAKVAAKYGGIYASHIRDESAGLLDSVNEAIRIGKEGGLPAHVSHIKAAGKQFWGDMSKALDAIKAARAKGQDITADQYPYIASSTQLAAMVVPHWARQGNAAEFTRIAADPVRGKKLREEIEVELADNEGGKMIRIARYSSTPSRVGKNLIEIARAENTTPLEVVLDIERHGGAQSIRFNMNEDDVKLAMAADFVATASDGSSHLPGRGDKPHPRAYGTFPRKIRYALDDKVITLEQAVRSNSGLPAEILRLPDRGKIKVGYVADLVIFDPKTFRDAATFDNPTQYAKGLVHLIVNGVPAIVDGKPKNVLPGKVLRLNEDGAPTRILKAARIWTGDPEKPWAEAVAIRGSEVVAVGSAKEVEALKGPNTRVIAFEKGFAMPGLIDAHGHVSDLGANAEEVDLRGVASLDAVRAKIKAAIEANPGDSWIRGANWDQTLWPGGKFPTASDLDSVSSNRPVWLRRVDGHAGWANSEALRRAKVDENSKAPSDGQILKDDKGKPTGVFIDGAMWLVGQAVPASPRADLERRILAAQKILLENGLTGVHDAGLSRLEIEAYRALDRAGKLKVRIYGMASPPGGKEVEFVSNPPPKGRPEDRFKLRAIKLFIDGAMGSRGALMFEPYSDDPHNKGLLLIEPDVLQKTTKAALEHGWQVCIHAIGDKGNALVLDAFEAALKAVPKARDPRLRIEHAQVVRKADVARFKALGVIASMQPSHSSDDMRWADARLGPGRVDGAYAWKWFLDANVPMAFGSDFPVEIVSPFWGIYAGLTRQDEKGLPANGWHPDQKLSLDETLRGFTAGATYASFDEDRIGVLRPGMKADITVLDRDPGKVPALDILKTKVLATIIDGQ